MAQWKTLTGLCQTRRHLHSRVVELYCRINFPYKIRALFADWIESQDWSSVDLAQDAGLRRAEQLYKDLVTRIERCEDELQMAPPESYDLDKIMDIGQARETIKRVYEGQYRQFVDILRRCLQEERVLMQSCDEQTEDLRRKQPREQPRLVASVEITQQLGELKRQLGAAERMVTEVDNLQNRFGEFLTGCRQTLAQFDAQLLTPQSEKSKNELVHNRDRLQADRNRRIQENLHHRNCVSDQLISIAISLANALQLIWGEIRKWLTEQKLEMTGLARSQDGTLDHLDNLCDGGGELLYVMIHQIEIALAVLNKMPYEEDVKKQRLETVLKELVDDYLPMHLQKTFVIEKNIPDRILKVSRGKSTPISMTVRILGGKALGLDFSKPKAKLSVFQEREIPESNVYQEGMCRIFNGNVHSNEVPFVVSHDQSIRCVAAFNSIQLMSFRRERGVGTDGELVTDNKFAFVFYTTINICQRDIPLKLVSLPVILISQTSQEIMAKGTLIWDAAFSEENRRLFAYKETVLWSDVAKVLSALFHQNTGRGLEPEHLSYLAKMAFRERKNLDFNNQPISMKQVMKDKLPDREFSFWKWVWANMNLLKDRVNAEWQAGLIFGFISKEDARRKLNDQPCGAFLLRFSETNIENSQKSDLCGYITLAVMELEPTTGQKKLFHVREYLSAREIQEKGMSHILAAMEVAEFGTTGLRKPLLRYLWPNVSTEFNEVFGPFLKQDHPANDGYSGGKYTITIFLSDAQQLRHREDSFSTDATNGNMMSPQSTGYPISPINSPGTVESYDLSEDCTDFESSQEPFPPFQQPAMNPRPMAAVLPQPQGFPTPLDGAQPSVSGMQVPAGMQEYYDSLYGSGMTNGHIVDDMSHLGLSPASHVHGGSGVPQYGVANGNQPYGAANGMQPFGFSDDSLASLLTLDDDDDILVANMQP